MLYWSKFTNSLEIEDKNKHYFSYSLKCKIQKMIIYSVRRKDRIFVEGYGFLSFPKNMVITIAKTISKSLSSK